MFKFNKKIKTIKIGWGIQNINHTQNFDRLKLFRHGNLSTIFAKSKSEKIEKANAKNNEKIGGNENQTKISNSSNNKPTSKEETEKYIYIMGDKYSVSPEKEIKIKTTITNYQDANSNEKLTYTKYISNFRKVNYLNYKDVKAQTKKTFTHIFFPRDYPNSVKDGYYQFSKYSFIGGIIFHIMNFLSSQSMIHALGMTISKPLSFSLSTGMNWALKDGIGQLGAIFFAGKFSNSIERDLKKWRLIALWMLNVGILCEIVTLYKPEHFLLIASTATLIKLSSFVATNSTRTGINFHFCKENNITDLANKFIAQANLSFIIGNVLGIILSWNIPSFSFHLIFPVVCSLSVFNLIYAYASVAVLSFSDMNYQRAFHVASEYIKSNKILDPAIVNKKETFLFKNLRNLHFCNYPLDKIFKKEKNIKYLNDMVQLFREAKFFTYVEKKFNYFKGKNVYRIYTFMRLDADNADIFIAFLYSVRLNSLLLTLKEGDYKKEKDNIDEKDNNISIKEQLLIKCKENLDWINSINKKELMLDVKEKRWDLNFHLLEEKYLRYHLLFK